MKVALFATCLVDTMVPQVAQATAVLLRAARPRGRRPAGADLLRPDARQHRLPARGRADRGQPRARVRRRGGDRRAVRVVRGLDPPPAGRRRAAGRGARAGRRGRRAGRAHLRAVPVPGRRPRRHRRRRLLPAPGHLPPDLPLAADAAGRRPAAAAAARRPRARPGRAARRRPVLRLRRHLRGQERRHLDRDAHRQDGQRALDARRGLHRRRRVLPDAHRRRAVPAALGHPHRAPGRDPRLDGGSRDARTSPTRRPGRHRPGTDRRLPRHPDRSPGRRAPARRPVRSRTPPARRSATASCGPTSATPPRPSAASGPPSSARCPTGRSCARPAGRSRPPPWPGSTSTWSRSRSRSPPAAAPCTGPATRTRPTRSSPGSCRPPAPTRWSRSSRWPPRRSGSTRRSRRPGIAAHETDLAELIVQLGEDKP